MAFLCAFNIALLNEDLLITQPSVKELKRLKSMKHENGVSTNQNETLLKT